MKLQVLASLLLPLLAVAEPFSSICDSKDTTTEVLDGVEYRYICKYRPMQPTGLINGLADRAACAASQHAAGCKDSLAWRPDASPSECYCSRPGWGTRTSNGIVTLVRTDPRKEDRDALTACQTSSKKYQDDLAVCNAGSGNNPGTPVGSGSVGVCPASGKTATTGYRGGNWDIYCNSYVSPFNRYKTNIRTTSLDGCIDVCNSAAETQCKGVTWENGGKCSLYDSVSATGGTITDRTGTHMAIRR